MQLCSDRDPQEFVGDLSVCLDGMQVDPEAFASAEREQGTELNKNPPLKVAEYNCTLKIHL